MNLLNVLNLIKLVFQIEAIPMNTVFPTQNKRHSVLFSHKKEHAIIITIMYVFIYTTALVRSLKFKIEV